MNNIPGMLPVVAERMEDIVKIALHNVDRFAQAPYNAWLAQQSYPVRATARVRPPDALYRVQTDNERLGVDDGRALLGIVIGYQERRGEPALCAVHVLGVPEGAGSFERPVFVPADQLISVTAQARAGKLRYHEFY